MKLLADMLNKGAYDKKECKALRDWVEGPGSRLDRLGAERSISGLTVSLSRCTSSCATSARTSTPPAARS